VCGVADASATPSINAGYVARWLIGNDGQMMPTRAMIGSEGASEFRVSHV